MKIRLENVLPTPLSSMTQSDISIWNSVLDIQACENVLVDAYSGKGKSTLISLLFGIRNDYQGNIYFDSKCISAFSMKDWTKLRQNTITAVFQDLQLFPKLSVRDNLMLKNKLTDFYPEQEIELMVERVGLKDKWNQTCGNLSMGQQQRIAIIRSILQPFQWIFLDEPFSHLDKINTDICLDFLAEKTKKNKAGMVLTSLGENYSISWNQHLFL